MSSDKLLRTATLLSGLGASLALTACQDNTTRQGHPGVTENEPPNLTCVPNLDGKIDANELQAAIGVQASFLVSPAGETRKVDLKGSLNKDGSPIWDFSQDFASDQQAFNEASDLSAKWYKSSFPEGEFAAPVDAAGTLEGVYRHSTESLDLLGIASKEEKPKKGQTLLVYDAPIPLYKFPIEPGKHWVASGEVTNGLTYGLPYAGKDTYDVTVGVTGQLELFDYTFTQVHRVKLHIVQEPAVGASISTRETQFLFECFGEVGRATSQPGEEKDDFTTAAEVRRLGQ